MQGNNIGFYFAFPFIELVEICRCGEREKFSFISLIYLSPFSSFTYIWCTKNHIRNHGNGEVYIPRTKVQYDTNHIYPGKSLIKNYFTQEPQSSLGNGKGMSTDKQIWDIRL